MSKKKKTIGELLEEAVVPEEEQPYVIPENWIWAKFDSVIKTSSNRANDIKQKDYEEDGEIPVIDQGIRLISGYTNNKETIYTGELPLIVFGDHTRCLKWVDFKFAQGADGTKLLQPLKQLYPKYFYYLLKSINFPSKGYSRHFKYLRENVLPVPPLKEQIRITEKVELLLNKIEEAKLLIEESKETFELRRAAILNKAFRGELTAKWRNKNGVEFSWNDKKVEELIKKGPQNGLYKPQKAYGTGTLIVRIDGFYNGKINDWGTLKRLQLEQSEIDLYGLINDDIIINRVNSIEYLGKSALVKKLIEPTVFESNVMRISVNDKIIPEYLILYLNSSRGLKELRKNAKHAVNQASINQQDVKNVIVPMPTIDEQEEIVRLLNNLLENNQKASNYYDILIKLDIMKKSILSRAFRGELGTNYPSEENAIELLKEVLQEQVK